MTNLGRFQHHSILEIHSRQAKTLVAGRYRDGEESAPETPYPVYGLVAYGLFLITLWQRIRADDPYAEMALIEVERRIQNAFDLLRKLDQFVEKQLSINLPGIQLDLYESKQPLSISLNDKVFATTHAKLGARLIGVYDLLVRKLVTGKQFGVINTQKFERYHYRASKVIRGVFAAPMTYKNIQVDRADIQQKTEKGIAAIQTAGPVPLDILNQQRNSEFGPKPPRRERPFSSDNTQDNNSTVNT